MITVSQIAFFGTIVSCMTLFQGLCLYYCFKKNVSKEDNSLTQECPINSDDVDRLEAGLCHAILLGPAAMPLLLAPHQSDKIQNSPQGASKVLKKH